MTGETAVTRVKRSLAMEPSSTAGAWGRLIRRMRWADELPFTGGARWTTVLPSWMTERRGFNHEGLPSSRGGIEMLAWRILLPAMLSAATVCGAQTATPPPPTFYKQLRYDEDYQYLRDSSCCADFMDAVKCIPLSQEGDWYLTLGGEIRERYEYFDNSNWGAGPQDRNGYLLQRYMVHADVHLPDHFRIFAQFKSGLEDGRNGGPRPTDEDRFDLNQLFIDAKATWEEKGSFTLRLGRQEMAFGASRLVSVRESPNVRRSFDGARGILRLGDWRVDAFAVKPVETNPGVFDDGPDPEQKFWGIYGVTPVSYWPGGHVDLYYLGIERQNAEFDQGTARELRHSLGARI